MVNLKITAGGAVTGLIISIISGLIGGVGFTTLLIRALICAIIGGGIGTGAYAVFVKYLTVDGAAEEPAVASRPVVTGTAVNISVGDDPLPETEGSPDFFVTNNDGARPAPMAVHHHESPVTDNPPEARESAPAPSASVPVKEVSGGFVPASLGTITSSSPKNVAPASSQPDRTPAAARNGSGSDLFGGLDVMPEIEEIVSSVDEPHDPGPIEVEESDFSEIGGSESPSSLPDVTVGSDAETMAKAIRTLLKSEG